MRASGFAVGLLLGVAPLTGCDDRSTPTSEHPLFSASTGSGQSSVVQDAVGDVKNKAAVWLDIVSASISSQGGRFLFAWDVAAPIPADPASDPAIPAHSDHVCLGDGIEADPTTTPVGYPFGKNEANFAEFYVALCWTPTGSFGLGVGFNGLLIDRRPLLNGGQAVVAPLAFSLEGTRVTVTANVGALGDPTTFSWVAFSEEAQQADPNDAAWFPDVAPEVFSGVPLAIWPQ
jgi:hypothetical protein